MTLPASHFGRLFVWFSLRHLLRHKGRLVTVLAGIALGAAVFASVRLSVQASLAAFERSVTLLSGRADAIVVRPGGRVSEQLVADIADHAAVRRVTPLSSTYVQEPGREAVFLLLGIDPLMDRNLRRWRPELPETGVGRAALTALVTEPGTLVAGRRLAQRLGWRPGARIQLVHTAGTRTFRVPFVLADHGLSRAEGGQVLVCDIATFQEFTGTLGVVDRLDVVFHPGSIPAQRAGLQSLLPPGVVVADPGRAHAGGNALIRAYELNLTVLSVVSLFVGMYLVYSLIALNVAWRRPELAILRSLGARAGTIRALFLTEGALLGLAGWVLAWPLGTVLTPYLLEGVSATISNLFVRVHAADLMLSPWEVVFSGTVTVGVCLLAALQPAQQAMGVPPHTVFAAGPVTLGRPRTRRRLAVTGAAMCATGGLLALLPGVRGIPLPGYAAVLALFVGFSLLTPLVVRGVAHGAAPLLRRAGICADMAGRYVTAGGARSAVSVGALVTAVALFTALVIMIHSFRSTVALWVHQTFSGDIFVAARLAEINRFRDPMPADLVRALRRAAPPAVISPIRRLHLHDGPHPFELEALDMASFLRFGGFVWLDDPPAGTATALAAGRGVVVSEVFANRHGVRPGQRFRTLVRSQRIDLPVLGVVRDYRTRGGVVFMDLGALAQRVPGIGWSSARLFLPSGRDRPEDLAALRGRLVSLAGDALEMIDGTALRDEVLRIFDETFFVTTVLLLIALAIAALSIASTLAMLVLERLRQLHILRAVGASHRQLRRLIFWEAGLLAAAGACLGLLCGLGLAVLLIYVINRQSFGWTFLFRIDWRALIAAQPLILLAALAASLPALWLVFRQPPGEVLREQ